MSLVLYTADIIVLTLITRLRKYNTVLISLGLLATEYICIDDQLPIERFTDYDIITTVQNEEEYENDSDNEYESQPIISVKVALESVDNLSMIHPGLICSAFIEI